MRGTSSLPRTCCRGSSASRRCSRRRRSGRRRPATAGLSWCTRPRRRGRAMTCTSCPTMTTPRRPSRSRRRATPMAPLLRCGKTTRRWSRGRQTKCRRARRQWSGFCSAAVLRACGSTSTATCLLVWSCCCSSCSSRLWTAAGRATGPCSAGSPTTWRHTQDRRCMPCWVFGCSLPPCLPSSPSARDSTGASTLPGHSSSVSPT
mmetsp:Transcript_16586/g.39807  ORF Transcript_16586/g.39807 Transcript_16586/m.39807 type:complete len:204 (+) Transcript_16586:415-1026(+)